jgi:hypothetical protein
LLLGTLIDGHFSRNYLKVKGDIAMSKHMIYKLLILVTIAISFAMPVQACDVKCKKASKRALMKYGNKIEQAETKSCKVDLISPRSFRVIVKSCKKDIRYLNIKYDGYSELIRSNPEIQALHKRHLALNDKLSDIEKLAQLEAVKKISEQSKNPLNFW